jgi:hypothetical protein
MSQLKVTFDQAAIDRLKATLNQAASNIGREVAIAINETSKKCSTLASRELKKEIDLPAKTLKKAVRPGIRANKKSLETTIVLRKGHPFPLKLFLKKTTTKTGKTIKRNVARNAALVGKSFVVKRYRDNIFKRATNKRGPLVLQTGPSPGEAFKQAGIAKVTVETAQSELPKQVERRIRFWKQSLAGQLRGNQK